MRKSFIESELRERKILHGLTHMWNQKQTNKSNSQKKRSDLWPPEATVGAGAGQIGEIGQK